MYDLTREKDIIIQNNYYVDSLKLQINIPQDCTKYDFKSDIPGITFIGRNKERLNIYIGENSKFSNCKFFIYSSTRYTHKNDKIIIGSNCNLNNLNIQFHDGSISIGNNSTFFSGYFVIEEGRQLLIGDNCLFASGIEIRTSDSHSILGLDDKRLNNAADVIIGNHVWIAKYAKILKGSIINHDSVLSYNSLLIHKFYEPNVIIAGNPARIVKKNIKWDINIIN